MLYVQHYFTIFNFIRLKEDVRIGLPAGWRVGVGEERCFMKGRCVILINFLFFIIVSFPHSIFFNHFLQSLLFCEIALCLCLYHFSPMEGHTHFYSCIIVLKIINIFHDSFICFIQIMYLLCSNFLLLYTVPYVP